MKRSMDVKTYKDKVYGAWAGKCAGGIIGAKQENNKSILHYTFDNVFPDLIPPNDDFDLQILYLQEVIEKQGFNFDANDLAREFALHNKCWANEYRVAIKNINCGIMPPTSGVFCNDFFKNSNGCPIRSELWGLIAPDNPERVCSFVDMDGCIDHTVESIEAEKFFAVLECKAFFQNDVIALVNEAVQYVSPQSNVYKCAKFVICEYSSGKSWQETRTGLIRRFGSSDASYSVVNMGIVLLALLYGKDNFNDTMLIAVNCGYDTDCTSGTAGAILGIIKGKSGLDPSWLEKIGEHFVVGTVDIVRKRDTLSELTEDTLALAYALWRDGLTDVAIIGLPEDYRCAIPKYDPFVSFKTEYDGAPSLSAEKACSFTVSVTNKTKKSLVGRLYCVEPEKVEIFLGSNVVTVLPEETVCVKGYAKLKEGVLNVLLCNKGELVFEADDRKSGVPFGFMGEAEYRLYGPYFDNYDTQKYDHDVNGETMPIDLFSMFNGFINIDNEYVAGDDPTGEDCVVFHSAEDKLPVEKYVTYRGPCCVYLVREFFCEEAQSIKMIVGHSAAHKVWVNGECVISNKENNVCWMPLNNTIDIKLKKGNNKFVYKLIRTNGEFEFSVILSKFKFGNGVLVELMNL